MPQDDGPKTMPVITSEQLLRQIRTDAWRQYETWSRRASRWRFGPVALGVLALSASGVAGTAIVAGLNTSTSRTVAAVLAFLGAILSGVAAAAAAPYRASDATMRSDRFAALHRWSWFALADLPKLPDRDASRLVRDILDWSDDISGVTAPAPLRQGIGGESGLSNGNGPPLVGDPQWEMALARQRDAATLRTTRQPGTAEDRRLLDAWRSSPPGPT